MAPAGNPQAVTSPAPREKAPSVTADLGGTVVYRDEGDGVIRVMGIDGSNDRAIGEGAELRVAPSGKLVSYVTVPDGSPYGDYDFWVQGLDGTAPTRIASLRDVGFTYGAAEWSPDGRRLVYAVPNADCDGAVLVCPPNPEGGAWLVDADGSNRRRLVAGEVLHPAFSRDGRRLTFGRGSQLMIADADGSNVRVVHRVAVGRVERPSVSPDGSRIAFHVRIEHPTELEARLDVGVVEVDGSGLRMVWTDGPWSRTQSPAWSPDGARFAFADAATAVVATAEGSRTWKVATTNYDEYDSQFSNWYHADPSWSPDGAWVIVGGADATYGTKRLHIVRPDGSEYTQLEEGIHGGSPTWLP